MKTLVTALVASFASGALASAQGKLWIVDDAAGPLVDFTNLQAAIDAAADGDTVMVRPGFHPSLVIDAKSLVVVAEVAGTPPTVSIGPSGSTSAAVTVRNVSAAQAVTLRGIRSRGYAFENCAGTIWGEDLLGPNPLEGWLHATPYPALAVTQCAAVVLQRCDLTGGAGQSNSFPGIRSSSSNLFVFDSAIAGYAKPGGDGGPEPQGALGKPGLELIGGSVFAAGSTLRGGQGGYGGLCSAGGKGGPGLELSGASPVANLLQTTLLGGPGGCAFEFPVCGCGGIGVPSIVLSGMVTTLAGNARHYQLSSPASGGTPPQVQYQGAASDLVFGALSLGTQPALALALHGALLPSMPPLLLLFHGQADGLGALSFQLGVPTIPPGFALTAYMQAGALATDGMVWLGAGSALTLVH